MSASSKKKLRKEQDAAKLTDKQIAAQKEAKQTKMITAAFVAVMAVVLVVAVVVGVKQTITNQGILEKNTTAMTIGEHKVNNAEMNYFFMDAVNNFYSSYGSYASMFGLDVTKPLNEQVVDEETGKTWADDFLESAKNTAVSVYAMSDAAKAAGYTLSEEETANIDSQMETLDLYATMYGYSDASTYLKAFYGNGANKSNYKEYLQRQTLASSYYNHYTESLTYTDADLQAHEAENPGAFSSYDFHSYYLAANKFATGGTTEEDGTVTYTDEENAAAAAAAEEAVKTLVTKEINSVESFDSAIAALSVNNGTGASTLYDGTLYTNVNDVYAEWISSADRKAGDKAYFASESISVDENGNETSSISGYYAVYFLGKDDNTFALKHVRHILVTPEHNHEEDETHEDGESYSEEELSAAKAAAEEILAQWKSGEATEGSFAELANEKSADGDGTTGGLYENIYPGQMVAPFESWCYDESRKTGDTGIVESDYGFHIMYFVGDSQQNYRDYQIEKALRTADSDAWYTSAIEAAEQTDGDFKYLDLDLVLNANG